MQDKGSRTAVHLAETAPSSSGPTAAKPRKKWSLMLSHSRRKSKECDRQPEAEDTCGINELGPAGSTSAEANWQEQYAAEYKADAEARIRHEIEVELRARLQIASASRSASVGSGNEAGELRFGECPICYEDMCRGRAIFTTECGHTFHFKCLQDFDVTGESPCPMCRAHLDEPPINLKNRQVHADWFHRITRNEAEAMLLYDGRHGAYLIRESHSRRGTYTLSFLHHTTPRHCRIFNTLDGKFAADTHRGFDTLQDLINWYMQHPIVSGTDGHAPVMLTVPCGKGVTE